MSNLAVNSITDASGGSTAQINGATPTVYNTMGRNRIINGAMEIDQRNAGAAVTGISDTSNYVPDRFQIRVDGVGIGRCSAQQVTDAPSGFIKSTKLTVTTTDASPVSGYGYCIRQAIEAYNTADMMFGTANAKTFTLSFWVKSSVTGSFGLTFGNAANNRWYGALYTISSANTWEYKTVSVAGDTTGTWEGLSNSQGLIVVFGLGGGGYRVIDTGWQTPGVAGTKTAVTGGVNLFATSGATFQITGVQLEVGSVATEFERRPYGMELQLCQRYYHRITIQSTDADDAHFCMGNVDGSEYIQAYYKFPTTMRRSPTALEQSGTAAQYQVRVTANKTCTSVPLFYAATTETTTFGFRSSGHGFSNGQAVFCSAVGGNSAYLGWSAEL